MAWAALDGLPSFQSAEVVGHVDRVLSQGLMDLQFHDSRRAFHSYAVYRGLGVEHNGPRMRLTGPGFDMTVEFNEQNLVVGMTGNMGGAQ